MSSNPTERILIIAIEQNISFLLEQVLRSAGYEVVTTREPDSAEKLVNTTSPALLILSENLDDGKDLAHARHLRDRFPTIPLLLLVSQDHPDLLKSALRIGITDTLCLPLHPEDILTVVQSCLTQFHKWKDWENLAAKQISLSLQRQVDEMERLSRLSRAIHASQDLNSSFKVIIDGAVDLTGAEEATLLLVDEQTDELYMVAGSNFEEEFVRAFRVPIKDSLPGRVILTGKPLLLNQATPTKLKASYLVYSVLYVPLQLNGRVSGVLGVDNRHNREPFGEHQLAHLSTLADHTAIVIENAQRYTSLSLQLSKQERILAGLQDGVIVIDETGHIILVNEVAKRAFRLEESDMTGKPALEVFTQADMQELIKTPNTASNQSIEINVEDGRMFNGMLAAIPGIGWAISINDITTLKRLDRIKSEFVGTVSHDLRSPLTSILGYVELIDRVGPVNDTQREFIQRVQASVNNISALVDDLLNLGRIEAGVDTRKELIHLGPILNLSATYYAGRAVDKDIDLSIETPEKFPPLYGNPIQIRQIIDNLLDNAIKYTPAGGKVQLHGFFEQDQIILEISDSGMGIPAADLPNIFDKFYRASNIPVDIGGTGLGLAIVKSVVEAHEGRIWVDSVPDRGSKFTIVLPIAQE
jgi:two-component system, OmpR family, phosphate regulon sensor histidine kinase PhoR